MPVKVKSRKKTPPRTPIPERDVRSRITDFGEVSLGYTEELALKEAGRCLGCKEPKCMEGCPVQVPVKDFIKAVRDEDFGLAISLIKQKNLLPAVCGRVCPQESQCESRCLLGKKGEPVAIGGLERFVADKALDSEAVGLRRSAGPTGKKVAVVGSGPAGLTCAYDLAGLGHGVTIFEAFHEAGGVLIYGIPEFRLPKAIVKKEIDALSAMGVHIATNSVVGKLISVDELMEGFDACFVATGAGLPSFMDIEGENLNGVYSANEFLTRVNLMKAYAFPEHDTPVRAGKKVAVVGGGNVAVDSARTALRLGAEEVVIIYRRSEAEMPARRDEVHHAKEEGVRFELLSCPDRIKGVDGWVKGVECVRMRLSEPDGSGRRRPEPVASSEFEMAVDTVIVAVGTGANPLVPRSAIDIKLSERGYILADETTGRTSKKGVFAGGDIVTGSATVISAMGAGRRSATAIHAYLTGAALPV